MQLHVTILAHAAGILTAWPGLASPAAPSGIVHVLGMPAPMRRACRTCPLSAGLREARQQLLVAGQVMVWLLHVAAPDLLHGRQLQLRGMLAVQEKLSASQRWEATREVEVTSFGVTATMQVKVWQF